MRVVFSGKFETSLVAEFFGQSAVGYFVDVGASHPIIGSQSWHLEQSGWKGVLVEPQPNLANCLRKERRARVCEVALSKPSNSGRTMPLIIAGN